MKINLQLSVMKPLHANWILQAWHMLNEKTHIVKLGWEKQASLVLMVLSINRHLCEQLTGLFYIFFFTFGVLYEW